RVSPAPVTRAATPPPTRPAGSQLLAAALKSKPPVVVAKLDRLFRSVADAANVIADFDKKGIQLVAIAESFDMGSPYGRAMAQMASVFAELERAMIRERTLSAMNVQAVTRRTDRRTRTLWLGLRLRRASRRKRTRAGHHRSHEPASHGRLVLPRHRHAAGSGGHPAETGQALGAHDS